MIEKYQTFEIERLLKDMPMHRATLESLREQLENLDGVGGMDSGERVGGTKPVDSVEQLVIRRMMLELKIENLQRDVDLIDRLFRVLPEDEQAAIEEFFWNQNNDKSARIKLMERLHLEQSAVYDIRRRAIARMKQMICG